MNIAFYRQKDHKRYWLGETSFEDFEKTVTKKVPRLTSASHYIFYNNGKAATPVQFIMNIYRGKVYFSFNCFGTIGILKNVSIKHSSQYKMKRKKYFTLEQALKIVKDFVY